MTFSLSGRAGQLGAVRLVQELGLFVGLDFTRRAGVCRRLIGKAIMSLVPTGTATDDQGAARPEVRGLRLMRLPRVNSLPWDNALRLTVAFILPVAIGTALGEAGKGIFCGAGAFLVANADPGGRRPQRIEATGMAFAASLGTLVLGGGLQPLRPALVAAAAVVLAAGSLAAAAGPAWARLGLLAATRSPSAPASLAAWTR